MSTDKRSSREIEEEIRHTRGEMDRTLDQLQGRFTTGNLVDQALHYLRDGTGGEFTRNLNESVRRNPVPVVLMGLSMAWLMASGREGRFSPHQSRPSRLGERMRSMRDTAGAGLHAARERLGRGAGSSSRRVKRSLSGAREEASRVGQQVGQRGRQLRHSGQQVWSDATRVAQEQPLLTGAMGLMVGVALAGMLPRSRRENEWLGEHREHLLDEAARQGGEQLRKAEQALESAPPGKSSPGESDRPSGL
ncbi:DUF3618 domain-containing protein [Alkalilimnicola sp. S0819]|uniref:DUF3618 domain-containing protein n=1 Tax=Alkalilimnicola sp. S0819 TaxID=2613922 RepID=UPI001262A669|nr:DUF3618 domain-containing protein [Alkalilimnicola sp. S0819]KAB7628322.1 DUF3618 domain-containing protein [Alkalilimnicola sp. S0819]MPQ15220.1 DUF3618 domain-containing protein [Alkalilimnicola sp. S0819]